MIENRIYSVVVNNIFYGVFSNRKNLMDSIHKNIDLSGAYIKGTRKNLDVTTITVANNFMKNCLTIYRKDDDNNEKEYIKVLMHTMNAVNPYYIKKEKNEAN